jgi:ubiquinone/menaquinone biosynthesis C-methylase UbiE
MSFHPPRTAAAVAGAGSCAAPTSSNRKCPTRLAALRAVFASDEAVGVEEAYRRAAPVYDGFRWLWLRLGAAGAEQALLRAAVGAIRPGVRVLDAGAGTGQLARRLHGTHPEAQYTLLDISPAMLLRATDVPGRHVLGSVTELPFPDEEFDLVVSGWVLETLHDPARAIAEFARVVAPGGRVVCCFCSRPSDGRRRARALTRRTVERRFAGSFRSVDPPIPASCRQVDRFRADDGLATTIVLEKR